MITVDYLTARTTLLKVKSKLGSLGGSNSVALEGRRSK